MKCISTHDYFIVLLNKNIIDNNILWVYYYFQLMISNYLNFSVSMSNEVNIFRVGSQLYLIV